MTLYYHGGPLDGQTERREFPPAVGDFVHRLIDGKYVTYVWDGKQFELKE